MPDLVMSPGTTAGAGRTRLASRVHGATLVCHHYADNHRSTHPFVPFVVHQLRATNRYMVDAKPELEDVGLYMTSIGSKSKFVERP